MATTKRKPSVKAVKQLEGILKDLDKWRENYMQHDPREESLRAANKLQIVVDYLKERRGAVP